MSEDQWISTREAAALLGKTDRHVRRYCDSETLHCKRDGKSLLVDRQSVEEFINEEEERPHTPVHSKIRLIEEEVDEDIEDDADTSNGHADIEIDDVREEDMLFLQNLADLQQAVEGRLKEEQLFVSLVRTTLSQLETRYQFERERNGQIQSQLSGLFSELQTPFAPSKPSLLKRLFGRK